MFAWLLVSAPIIGAGIELPAGQAIWLVYIGLNVAFALADEWWLKEAKQKVPGQLWFLIVPAYLWKRAAILKETKVYLWAWVVTFVISLVVTVGLVSHGDLDHDARPLVTASTFPPKFAVDTFHHVFRHGV